MEKRTKSELWKEAKDKGLTDGMKWTSVKVEELEAVLGTPAEEVAPATNIEPKEEKEGNVFEILDAGEIHCKHDWEFSFIQYVRAKPRVFADGKELPGERTCKDVFICNKCGAKQLRDSD